MEVAACQGKMEIKLNMIIDMQRVYQPATYSCTKNYSTVQLISDLSKSTG
jgi:hypothetical protein